MNLDKLQNDLLYSHDRTRGPATDAIASYNHFMDVILPYIVREFSRIEIISGTDKHNVFFGDIVVHKPLVRDLEATQQQIRVMTNEPLMPMEARNRGLTYSAEVFVNIEHTITNLETGQITDRFPYREVPLMQMPVMIRSKYCHLSDLRNLEFMRECPLDPGGYFIFNGNEKVIQSQKVQRFNCHIVKSGSAGCPIDMEIRSLQCDKKFRSTSTSHIYFSGTPSIVTIDIPYLAQGHNITYVFRALGLSGRDEIEKFLWNETPLDSSKRRLFDATLNCPASNPAMTNYQIFDALGQNMYNTNDLGSPEKIRRQVSQQITGELLPHCGFDDSGQTKLKKLFYLRSMIHQILDVYSGNAVPDDRDFEGYKAVHMSATLLSTMFRQLFSAFVKNVRNKMYDRFKKSKHLDIAAFVAHSDSLTQTIHKAFSDGELTVRHASNAGSAVIQIVHRINPLGLTTDLQKVRTPLPQDGKYILMRGVDATQLFSYCPAETPEGHGAGLLQNLSLFAKIRLGTEGIFVSNAILHAVPDFASYHGVTTQILEPLKLLLNTKGTFVFVNGEPIATTHVPETLVIILRKARRAKILPSDTSIIWASHGIAVFTDTGTVQFPLICLETLRREGHRFLRHDNSILIPNSGEIFNEFVACGIIEYVEAWEALDYRVAFKESDLTNEALTKGLNGKPLMPFTHLALHPMSFLGTSASTVPWSDHDQAPRVSYQAGMLKQSISVPAVNINERFDQGYAYNLWYPQRPIADTVVSDSRKVQEWPMGENLIIAIASFEGLSQEDAIVRSKSAIDRGSGRITVTKMFKAVIHKISTSDFEAFESPVYNQNGISCIGIRAECDYSKIDCSGLLTEGTYIRNGDVLIGRVIYTYDDSGVRVRRDRSVILTCEESEDYIVDKVMLTINRDGFRQVRIKIRSMRVPQMGDKISDRHGQKGVIGFLANQEDLPFVADGPNAGMTPDAIVNLHCINGRMTIGKLLEMLYSNLGLAVGSFVDASPFKQLDAHWAIQELLDSGYGTETTMINGKTGEPMTNSWFLGSCFYQSLKHMVLDKIAARNRGPRAALTRQPLEGRAKQGGLRVGEMERDAFIAHGASLTLDDRSRIASDGHVANVCSKCGQIGETTTKFTLKDMLDEDALIQKEECRVCGGPVQKINTTYCYSNLLARELAAVGIKIEHSFAPKEDLISNIDELMIE